MRAQLKLRAALMPEVVSAVEALEAQAGASRKPEYVGTGGRPRQRSWAVSPKLFPCELSSEAKAAISEARQCSKRAAHWADRAVMSSFSAKRHKIDSVCKTCSARNWRFRVVPS